MLISTMEIMEDEENCLRLRKKKTRRGKKRYKSDPFDFGCIVSREKEEGGLTDFSLMTSPTKQQRKRPNMLRPRSPRAPQNSTTFIIDNHIEGVNIDLSPHVEDDLPMYLANASWVTDRSMSQFLNSFSDETHKNSDPNEVSFYADDEEKYGLSTQKLSPAYSDIDYEYVSPIRNLDRYGYMCKDFDDTFKSAKEIELSHQTKGELHKNILYLEERICILEKKSARKLAIHSSMDKCHSGCHVNRLSCDMQSKAKSETLAQMLGELKKLKEENQILSNVNMKLKQVCVS